MIHSCVFCLVIVVHESLVCPEQLNFLFFRKILQVPQIPAPCIENVPNRDTTVSYQTEPWILWTVTPLIYIYICVLLSCYNNNNQFISNSIYYVIYTHTHTHNTEIFYINILLNTIIYKYIYIYIIHTNIIIIKSYHLYAFYYLNALL